MSSPLATPHRPRWRRSLLPVLARALLGAAMALIVSGGWARAADVPGAEAPVASPAVKYAGTYRIEGWPALEQQQMHLFFYLHPAGKFLLAAEWPQRESSRAVGTWSAGGDRLSLIGTVDVRTNQGRWRVPFHRSYTIEVGREGFRLVPVPEKNRFGMLGWPTAYRFYQMQPRPNLPGEALPAEGDKLLALIGTLEQALQQP